MTNGRAPNNQHAYRRWDVVDYSEGYLNLKRMVDEIWQAILDNDTTRARDICAATVVEARLLRHQIGLQSEKQNVSPEQD
jgi:hypothetical protein